MIRSWGARGTMSCAAATASTSLVADGAPTSRPCELATMSSSGTKVTAAVCSRGMSGTLISNAQGGKDRVDATALEANCIQLTINGGLGGDFLIGSKGNDLINGGDGNDTVLMGGGDDVFVWNPGDDNDILEGQAGFDRMI